MVDVGTVVRQRGNVGAANAFIELATDTTGGAIARAERIVRGGEGRGAVRGKPIARQVMERGEAAWIGRDRIKGSSGLRGRGQEDGAAADGDTDHIQSATGADEFVGGRIDFRSVHRFREGQQDQVQLDALGAEQRRQGHVRGHREGSGEAGHGLHAADRTHHAAIFLTAIRQADDVAVAGAGGPGNRGKGGTAVRAALPLVGRGAGAADEGCDNREDRVVAGFHTHISRLLGDGEDEAGFHVGGSDEGVVRNGAAGRIVPPAHSFIVSAAAFRIDAANMITLARSQSDHARFNVGAAAAFNGDRHVIGRVAVRAQEELSVVIADVVELVVAGFRRDDHALHDRAVIVREIRTGVED